MLNPSGTHIQAVCMFNACTGRSYALPESTLIHQCPMKDISFVYNQDQVITLKLYFFCFFFNLSDWIHARVAPKFVYFTQCNVSLCVVYV